MNLLTDKLPYTVSVNGKDFEVDTDYSTSIRFEQLMLDRTISGADKVGLALNLYYPVVPDDINGALEAIKQFYRAENTEGLGGFKGSKTASRIYDFDFDAPYIYAAFLKDYGIDLTRTEHLHWWAFRALFAALSEDNAFCKIMNYRAIDTKKFKGEERKFYAKMQKLYAIPAPKAEREKLDAVTEALLNGGDLSNLVDR